MTDLRSRWSIFRETPALRGFSAMRDKLIAHAELRFDEGQGKYLPFDVAQFGLTYADLDSVLTELEALVVLVNLIFRAANFAFDEHDKQVQRASNSFWEC